MGGSIGGGDGGLGEGGVTGGGNGDGGPGALTKTHQISNIIGSSFSISAKYHGASGVETCIQLTPSNWYSALVFLSKQYVPSKPVAPVVPVVPVDPVDPVAFVSSYPLKCQ